MSLNDNNLIWIDLEMTGLNPEKNCILEIATLITNTDLTILAEGPTLAIYQSECKLSLMDKWNINVHTASGLINRVQQSNINEIIAEKKTLAFLSKWVSAGKSPMCGNSIYQDRRFLFRYMPTLEAYFHYRCLDISTLKELAQRWKPSILKDIKKQNVHQALEDIHDSVKELSYYRKYFISN